MPYLAKEIIDDVKHRAGDTKNELNRTWLLHLLNLAQEDFAKKTLLYKKEYKLPINTQWNSYRLPSDFVQLKGVKYSVDGRSYLPLSVMTAEQILNFNQQIFNEDVYNSGEKTFWKSNILPKNDGWIEVEIDNTNILTINTVIKNNLLEITIDKTAGVSWNYGGIVWKKALFLNSTIGFTIEVKFIVPSIPSTMDISACEFLMAGGYFQLLQKFASGCYWIWWLLGDGDIPSSPGDIIIGKVQVSQKEASQTIINVTKGQNITSIYNKNGEDLNFSIYELFFGIKKLYAPDSINQVQMQWEYITITTPVMQTVGQGQPTEYFLQGNYLVLDAVQAGYILLDYYFKPSKILLETDSLMIDTEEEEALIFYMLERVCVSYGQEEKVIMYNNLYEDKISSFKPKQIRTGSLWQSEY